MATILMPAESVISIPCVAFALRRESMYFRRAYRFSQRFSGAACRAQLRSPSLPLQARTGATVLMLETGIGAAAMESALRWCLSGPSLGIVRYRPRVLICAGFSGALQPEQRVGDLIVASEVVDHEGNRWPAILPDVWDARDIAAGRLLTVSALVGDPQEKQRLGRRFGALAVDMESAVAARLCHQLRVPFACLRVISDDWQTALSPDLVELLIHARVSLPRLVGRVLRHPKLIGELWRLAGQTRRASQRLLNPLSALIRDGLRMGVGG